jgi:hypothetical protein
MATISNTPRPGYIWDATDNCWYPIGVGQHSHGEIPASTVDAKGDILVGTANDTVSKRSVGVDGSVLIADSTQATGLNWAGTMRYAGKNKFINGDMSIWQRGTTFTGVGTGTYTADRWNLGHDGSGTATVSRQAFTPGAAPVAGYEGTYFLRHQIASTSTTTFFQTAQLIEDVRTFAGRTVTVSFWAKADAARSMAFYLEQTFGSGGSSIVMPVYQTFNITTSWARYSVTFDIASVAGKTIGNNSYLYCAFRQGSTTVGSQLDLWGVQIEEGSVATPFVPAGGGSQQAELALCHRYYQRYKADSAFDDLGYSGKATSTTVIYANRIPFVPFRTVPSSVDFANVSWISSWGAATTGVSAIALSSFVSADTPLLTFTTTGLTIGTTYILLAGNTSDAYIGLSAEL